MAKKKPADENMPAPKYTLPEGYERRSDDVKGFWNPELGPVHFVPQEAALFDGSDDPSKPSIIIFGTLVDPCSALTDKEGEPVTGAPGDRVGVWGKPGMRGIRKCCGVPTFMFLLGEQDTGKRNPMKVFEVGSAREGVRLPVDDRRKLSRDKRTFLTNSGAQESSRKSEEEEDPF